MTTLRIRLFGRLNVCCLAKSLVFSLALVFVFPFFVGFASSFTHIRNCSTQVEGRVCQLVVSTAVFSRSLRGFNWVVQAARAEEIVSLPLSLPDQVASVVFSKDETDLTHNIFSNPDKFLAERFEKHRKKQQKRAGEKPLVEGFIGTDITENRNS